MADIQIIVIEGPNEGREFDLSGATTIGRDPSAGLVIDDPESSRRHASLSVEGDSVSVEDLGSTNGTFVNGTRLTAAQTLSSGDKVRIGTTVFELRIEAEAAQATRVGSALPDLDDIQVTAPRNVPDFAKDEPPAAGGTEVPAPASAGPPGGVAGPPGGAPEPPPPPGGAPPPPVPASTPPPVSTPPPAAGPPPPPAGGPPPPPAGGPPPPPSPGPPPPPAYAAPPVAAGGPPAPYGGGGGISTGSYPVSLEADYPQGGIARWRALFQGLLAFPHFIVLAFVVLVGYFALIGAFFSILFTRRYPPGIFNYLAGMLRWQARLNGYLYLMTEQYPPFSLGEDPYPIRLRIQYPENGIARWRALFQGLLAIPHFIVLGFLGFAQYFAFVIVWFSILFTRNYPPGVFNFILGCMRWQTRVSAYSLWMTEEYPPFSLE